MSIEEQEPKVYGTWRGRSAFRWYGFIYLMIGSGGSWVRVTGNVDEFEPYSPADLNDPKNRHDLKRQRVGGEYVGRYSTKH